MQPNYQEEIRKLLDDEGLINKTLSFGCVIREPNGGYNTQFAFERDNEKKEEVTVYCSCGNAFVFGYGAGFNWEVLGHPWDLREVMAYLGKYSHRVTYRPWYSDLFIDPNKYIENCRLEFDPSKPLSQQDLKPLYELMISIRDNK